jgi:small subunit ribosomal protein S7
MSRRNISRKNFPNPDTVYNSLLVSLLTVRIIKSGKKSLARRIIKDVFDLIENRTGSDPVSIFEKAVKNVTPVVELKACRVGGSTYQVPIEVSGFRGTNLSLRWIVKAARTRSGKTFAMKLANELVDASNSTGSAIRKKEETHKMAEANKAFAHFRY